MPKSKLKSPPAREVGLVTQVAAMLREQEPLRPHNRRMWRAEARQFIADPIEYEKFRLERIADEKEQSEQRNTTQKFINGLKNLFKASK